MSGRIYRSCPARHFRSDGCHLDDRIDPLNTAQVQSTGGPAMVAPCKGVQYLQRQADSPSSYFCDAKNAVRIPFPCGVFPSDDRTALPCAMHRRCSDGIAGWTTAARLRQTASITTSIAAGDAT